MIPATGASSFGVLSRQTVVKPNTHVYVCSDARRNPVGLVDPMELSLG